MSRPIITLTTDFGQAGAYAGIMKGVMLGICPEAVLVDISHAIRPQGVREAAYILSKAVPYFPQGAVHLVVVDPGVGSQRRPIAVQTTRAIYVAPDNGLLSQVLAKEPGRLAVHLTAGCYHLSPISATFQGRDVFAPAAAHLACGVALRDMGEEIPLPELATLPVAEIAPQARPDGSWRGQVVHVDHFGNLVTNLPGKEVGPGMAISAGGVRVIGLSRTFNDVAPGEIVAYIGSSGHLEIAVREGSAADGLGLQVGDPVEVGYPGGAPIESVQEGC